MRAGVRFCFSLGVQEQGSSGGCRCDLPGLSRPAYLTGSSLEGRRHDLCPQWLVWGRVNLNQNLL